MYTSKVELAGIGECGMWPKKKKGIKTDSQASG